MIGSSGAFTVGAGRLSGFSGVFVFGTGAGVVGIICSGSYSIGLKLGVPASQKVIVPFGSSFNRDVFFGFFSLLASTHPGILIIGTPICCVMGGTGGIA